VAALLCEACGYEIGGLEARGACPECGRAIAESLPSYRHGSPWQRRPGLWSLAATDYLVLRRARDVFGRVRIDARSGVGLALLNCVAAAMMLVAPWSGVMIGDPLRTAQMRGDGPAAALWVIPAQVAAGAGVLMLLTLVECAGIQIVAWRRGWRLSPVAAWQVCAHATVGWVVMGVTMWLGLIVWLNMIWFVPGLKQGGSGSLMFVVPLAGIGLGLLVFELLVWAGARRCRFASGQIAKHQMANTDHDRAAVENTIA
jgi:hypothetical protein